jgi:ABC-type metal ion transport system substrate-binding protein
MQITEKQRSYIAYAIRSNRFDKRIPNRMEYFKTESGAEQGINMIYRDLDDWLCHNVSLEQASLIIGGFQHDDPEDGFQLLVSLGMPLFQN